MHTPVGVCILWLLCNLVFYACVLRFRSQTLGELLGPLMVTEPFAEKHTILVSRQFFMPSVKRAVQDSDFSFDKALHVIFAGEEADDLEGPRREFFK